MAEPLTIARPYAEAAFQLARESGDLPTWGASLDRLAAVARTPQAHDFFGNPRLSAKQVADAVAEVAGVPTGPVHGFVQVLAANERLGVLPEIAELFDRLRNAHEGVVDARVTSAFPMSDAQVADVVAVLSQRFGRQVKVTVDVNPELIGGISIRVGDEVTDLSVRGKLSQLAGALMN